MIEIKIIFFSKEKESFDLLSKSKVELPKCKEYKRKFAKSEMVIDFNYK